MPNPSYWYIVTLVGSNEDENPKSTNSSVIKLIVGFDLDWTVEPCSILKV